MTNTDAYRLYVFGRKIESAIDDEVKKRIPDMIRLHRLKKLRLSIKDRLAGYIRESAFG
ncbi:MAG: hypothetical protein ACOYLS_00995 [Polymorphobacter sp.]